MSLDELALVCEAPAISLVDSVRKALRWKTDRTSSALHLMLATLLVVLVNVGGYSASQLLLRVVVAAMAASYVYAKASKTLGFPCPPRVYQPVTITFSTRLHLEDVVRELVAVVSWKDPQRSWRVLYIVVGLAMTATFLNTSITLYILFLAIFVAVNGQ